MPEVLSGSCHGEGEGPIPRTKREGHLRRLSSSGYPWNPLQGPSGSGEGVRQEVEGEEAAEGSEGSEIVRRLRSLRHPDPKEWECQVLSALLGGSEWSMA